MARVPLRKASAAMRASGKTGSGKKFYPNIIPGSAVKSEPLYVAIITPVIHHCMGGLLVDTDSACVGSNNLAIPGPYNAGEVAGKGIACLRMSFSCVTLRCSPTHERNHNPSVGVRIGEAAHPGPFPDESDDEAGGLLAGLDLKSMLLPLITKLIKKAIADLLKDESILASVRGLQKPTTHAARGATGPKEGPERQIAKGKGAQSRSHGKGGPDVRVSEHKNSGRGAKAPAEEFRPHPTRGKGKGNAAAHEASSWTVVARKSKDADAVFQLRAQDWNAPLLSFAGLGAQIEKTKSGESIQGVLMASKAELTTAHSMLKSSAKPYSVLLICLEKGPKSQRIPGRVGDTLRFRDAIVEQVTNDERLARAAPKDMKDPYKVKQLQTSLLYMRIPKIFATDTVWQEFKTGPERASMKWASAHHVQGIDAFGWVEEQIKNAQGTQLFGILRVPTADVGTLLGVSGQNGPRAKMLTVSAWNGCPAPPSRKQTIIICNVHCEGPLRWVWLFSLSALRGDSQSSMVRCSQECGASIMCLRSGMDTSSRPFLSRVSVMLLGYRTDAKEALFRFGSEPLALQATRTWSHYRPKSMMGIPWFCGPLLLRREQCRPNNGDLLEARCPSSALARPPASMHSPSKPVAPRPRPRTIMGSQSLSPNARGAPRAVCLKGLSVGLATLMVTVPFTPSQRPSRG